MAWNLQIVPKGLLLSKYIKNVILFNPNNVKNVEASTVLFDQYQTFDRSNNTANIIFQLSLYNTNPQNQNVEPSISSINFIQISNDPLFSEVYYLIPAKFSQSYNLQTDYVLDLSSYSLTQSSLPTSQAVTFTETNGSGNIIIKNWVLSGSSGPKKVYFSLNASLTDGTNATYPEGLDLYDEIIVCSSFLSSPGVPKSIAKSRENFSSSPLYFESDVASNSGTLDVADYGVASYFWDGLILKSSDNLVRNNYSQENIQLFNSINPKSSNLNQEKLPVVFSTSVTSTTWSSSLYKKYITSNAFNLTSNDNVYFFECFVNNYTNNLNFVNGKSFFYEFNITNSTGSTKYLRQQLVLDEQFTTLIVYISIDDTTWSSDSSYIPSALYKTITITDPDVISQITQSGSFVTLVELLDTTNKILQSKIIFKPQNSANNYVIAETLFTSNSFNLTGAYGEFKFFLQNSTYTNVLESVQYGICQGTISAAVTPSDKILTDYSGQVFNSSNNLLNSEKLNTWFLISNSPSSGVINSTSTSVQIFNNQDNDSINNLSAVEIQSSIPTFSIDSTLISRFTLSSVNASILKTGYSFDNNLNYENFTFNDLLKTASGIYLPQNNAAYEYISSLSWSGSSRFDLNVFNVGVGQTCSISTTKTDNLFFYSQANNSGTLTPPTIIKTLSSISSSNIFRAWIGTNGISTSFLLLNSLVVKNKGLVPITITSSAGLSTISPGEPFVSNSISTNSSQPTELIVTAPYSSPTSSLNFLYDFGKIGTITDLSLRVQIATPPECPTTLPSFQYSVEISEDFINWTFVSSLTATDTFYPSTGDLQLDFSDIDSENVRFARVRLYYNVSVTFDPRVIYRYSSLQGTISSTSSLQNTGKLIFGFTDTSAKNSSLNQLYNQPTYLRKYITNSSVVNGISFDFSEFSASIGGPVYINLLTESDEKRFYTIANNFNLNTEYTISFSVQRSDADQAFHLKPYFSMSGGNLTNFSVDLNDILTEPIDTQSLVFGFYPFISLVGNGNATVSYSVFKGTYNHGLNYDKNKTYFSLMSSENPDYTSQYGKNILSQNTYGISSSAFPQVNTYFSTNNIKNFSYDNVTFTVKAASTSPVGLYGQTYVDGIYLDSCDYILVAGQADKTTNGIYQVQSQEWVKQSALPSSSNLSEPTVLVSQGNIFENTLWMQDKTTSDWLSNLLSCPIVLQDNNLLFTGVSSSYKYPQFIKLACSVNGIATQSSLNQVQVKIANTPSGFIKETDSITQWNSLIQNGQVYNLQEKANANNTVFVNFAISSSQISGISTISFPAIYNLITSYSGNFAPAISEGSDFVLPDYGSDYRIFKNANLIYQLFSTYDSVSVGSLSTAAVNSSVYALNFANLKSPQSGFSTDIIIDNVAPTVGILSVLNDQTKLITLGISTASDTGSGLYLARIVQRNPSNEIIYGSWFGFNTNSFYGISTLTAYPSYVSNVNGITTGEPLSGYYRYSVQVADSVGNISQTNQVESFYYESALVDTQGPGCSVQFVNSQTYQPISISSSTIITAQMFASDTLSQVKAFRYRILPSGEFGNWIDYNEYTNIYLPQDISDGTLSIQFQFKDFGNNVLYTNATVQGESVYVYTWNIVSKLINNTLFTITESTVYNDSPVLLIGASKKNSATLFVWDNNKLIELQYPGFLGCKAVTALIKVGNQVVIGTDNGSTFTYRNGVVAGPFAQLKWGDTNLPISKFEIHSYPEDSTSFVYATTLNIPRIFRTPIDSLRASAWEVVQTPLVTLEKINVLNSGLWSGTQVSYTISSSYIPATLSPVYSYGVSSVIVASSGSNLPTAPTINVGGPITNLGLQAVMQGSISQIVLLANGRGYSSGATVTIESPAVGISSLQATGVAVTNSLGQIVSIVLTSPGYGYTSLNPRVTITGNSGNGTQATATAITQFDSIYSVNVTSAGIATTSAITLTTSGGAVLIPTFLYRIPSITLSSPGFGYTSSPVVSINGLTTLANSVAEYGSVQSITVSEPEFTFPLTLTPSVSLIGGASTAFNASLSTTLISFSTGGTNSFLGFVLNSVNISSTSNGFGTVPQIVFSGIGTNIFYPQLEYILSDDILLYSSTGSIYDIKSFDDNLFITNSTGDLIQLGYSSGIFNATRQDLYSSSNTFGSITPINLAKYNNGTEENLYFSVKEEPYIGKLSKIRNKYIFDSYRDNILLFKPFNFDIISNWQLKKIINANGSADVSYGDSYNSSVNITSSNSQVFYESTKDNTWFNRCINNNNYLVLFEFQAVTGTQSFEISTFNSTLKVAFSVQNNGLQIAFGNNNYSSVIIDLSSVYNIYFAKNSNDLYIYNNDTLVYQETGFFTTISAQPVIKFGYIFEPEIVSANGETLYIFGLPSEIGSSQFVWKQIKFSFNNSTSVLPSKYYSLSLPYLIPNSSSVRALRNINNMLFAATKSIADSRTTSTVPDVGTKVFKLEEDVWTDVTGNFDSYAASVSTSYIITSPNDINSLGQSYFITGLVKSIPSRQASNVIILGLTSNVIYEEQSGLVLTIIYPYNIEPAGKFLYLSSNNSVVSLPTSVYFSSSDQVKTLSLGIGSTSIASSATLTVTDGTITNTISANILPIGIATLGFSTGFFVGYSQDSVIANIQLTSTPKTSRTITLNSNNSSVLSAPNNGIATIPSGSIGLYTSFAVGTAVASNTNVTVSAAYRSTFGIATITATPFVLSVGLNTNIFVGNESTRKVFVTSSVQRSPIGVLTVNYASSNSSVLSVQSSGTISPSSFSTTTQLSVGSAVTTNTQINITGRITGSISTGISTATPFVVTSATTDLPNPVLGLQTSQITFTINTTPLTNVSIRNIVSSPSYINLVFPTFSTVLAGTLSTTFAISTTVQTASGIAITVKGAPFSFNTSPTQGLVLSTDVWRITNLSIAPNSIVGNGLYAGGIGQSYIVQATLNVGLSTTVIITSSTGFVSTRNINFLTTSTGSASSIGYATGFSTSAITNVTLTAIGPNGLTSSVSGLFLNPLLISSFSTSYIWNDIATLSPNYIVGGIGATAIGIITLNSYVATGVHTILIRTNNTTTPAFIYGQAASSEFIGLATVYTGSNTTSINFGANFVSVNTSETITARIISSGAGVATTPLNIYTYPEYNAVFYPAYNGRENYISVSVATSLPVSVGFAVTFDNGINTTATLYAQQNSLLTSTNLGTFKTDKIFTAQTVMLGSLQTYFVTGYGKTGNVFGMGYNYYGELSYNYPVFGPSNGSADKVSLNLGNIVKTSSGYHHSLALDSYGNVYGIGYNAYNQIDSTGISTNTFKLINTNNTYVRNIFAEGNTSYFVTADNKLYGFGENNSYSLGTTAFASTSFPYLIASNVYLADIYINRGSIVGYNNRIGIQTVYEFGGGTIGVTSKPITNLTNEGVIEPISNLNITNIDIAQGHTVACGVWSSTTYGISSSGVFAWGNNDYYQIGTSSSTGFITTPNILHKFTKSGVDHISQSNNIYAENRLSGVIESYLPVNEFFVSSVTVNTQGIGYTFGATVTFSAPPTTSSSVTATGYAVTNTIGIVSSVLITNQGSGYNLGAAVTFSPPPSGINTRTATGTVLVSANKVDAVSIVDPGNGYTNPPTVFITPISGGSGATGIASMAYSQITNIIVSNAGFGYTSAPTVTITASTGVGATATAIIESNSYPVNIIYQVGASVTSNATGFGIAQTSIAKPFYVTIPQLLSNISKNSKHFVWTMKSSLVYVSGGSVGPIPLTQLTTTFTQSVRLFAQNQPLNSNELYSYVYTSGSNTTISLFAGAIVQSLTQIPSKISTQYQWGSTNSNEWGWALTLKSDGSIDFFRQSNEVPKYVQNYLSNVYGNTFIDVSATSYLKPTRSYGDSNYSPLALSFGVGTTSSVGNIFVVRTRSVNSYNVYLSKATSVAPVAIESGYLSYQYNSLKTFANFALGYANGVVELYVQTSFGFGHSLLATWNPDGSRISILKSLINATIDTIVNVTSSSSNFVYFYVGTVNRTLNCYYAWNSNFTSLGSAQSPTLLNSVVLNSNYGYVKYIESFTDGLIIVATSNNYLLVMGSTNLTVYGSTVVPGTITSLTSSVNNQTGVTPSDIPTIFVTTTFNIYAYEINITPNYEIGLNYYNISGDYQLMTQSGLQTGSPITNIFNTSTNDTFTLLLQEPTD